MNKIERALPEKVEDSENLIIQIKSDVPDYVVNVYDRGQKYAIKFSQANMFMVGTKNADGRVIQLEEMIRLYPLYEDGTLYSTIHGLAVGVGAYGRLKEHFEVVGELKPVVFDFKSLTKEEQIQYKQVAESMFGKTNVFVETGEPIYFNEDATINPISKFVLDRMQMMKNLN